MSSRQDTLQQVDISAKYRRQHKPFFIFIYAARQLLKWARRPNTSHRASIYTFMIDAYGHVAFRRYMARKAMMTARASIAGRRYRMMLRDGHTMAPQIIAQNYRRTSRQCFITSRHAPCFILLLPTFNSL